MQFDSSDRTEREWFCQWCDCWHVGKTNCEGQNSREEAMSYV